MCATGCGDSGPRISAGAPDMEGGIEVKPVYGPFRRLETKCDGPWMAVAEEVPIADGSRWWDCYLQNGLIRVPLGPNIHREPHAEIARLYMVRA